MEALAAKQHKEALVHSVIAAEKLREPVLCYVFSVHGPWYSTFVLMDLRYVRVCAFVLWGVA